MIRIASLTGALAFSLGMLMPTGSASAADTVIFQLDWLPGGDKAPVYLGVQEGLFEAEGLEVEIRSGRGSSDAVTKLGTGAADIGTGGLGALMSAKAESDVPVKAVMSIYTKQPDVILTDATSGIASFADLAGKTIATAPFSASNVTWPLVLEANGLDPESVTLLKVEPGALGPMLATGQVDGTINWITKSPSVETNLAEAGKEMRILPWSEYGFDGYGLALMASERMIEERPDVLARFVSAYGKALELSIADPGKAAAALKAMVPEIDAAIAADEFAASVPLIDNEISKADGMGAFQPDRLAETWDWVAKSQGYAADAIDPDAIVDRSFVGS